LGLSPYSIELIANKRKYPAGGKALNARSKKAKNSIRGQYRGRSGANGYQRGGLPRRQSGPGKQAFPPATSVRPTVKEDYCERGGTSV